MPNSMSRSAIILSSRLTGRAFRLACAWGTGLGALGGLLAARDRLIPWVFMWLLVGTLLLLAKVLALLNLELEELHQLGWRRGAAYLFLWPGTSPRLFLPSAPPPPAGGSLWLIGFRNILVGLGLLALAISMDGIYWPKAWLGMAGLSLVFHFGVFDLLAAAWRRARVPVEKLFDCPIRSTSLGDFWGKRWNRIFSTFARELIFRPLSRLRGPRRAGLAVFAFSGLAHELVISVPAGAGYGGPFLYFLLQGLLFLVENTRPLRKILNKPLCGWTWTALAILAPLPLLFHGPFLDRVVIPFLNFLGS